MLSSETPALTENVLVCALDPSLPTRHACPYCVQPLDTVGWYMPGMRMLADLVCPRCTRTFYGDLPAGHGLYYPMLLEKETGQVHDAHQVPWFAESLASSYAARTDLPLTLTEESVRPLRRPVLLNCLDYLYGHCLLKLLNAQVYLDRHPDLDLVVLVPRFLRWMVPDGAAAIWTVDLPLRRGQEWNDWLAEELKRRMPMAQNWKLAPAFAHPHPNDFEIARFTGVEPFELGRWAENPAVTFIWREDRLWSKSLPPAAGRLAARILRRAGLTSPQAEQTRQIVRLAERMRQSVPALDFAVAGLGTPGGLPAFISDLRTTQITGKTETEWCGRYARSQIVIGVHGSSLLLPSAHAGVTIDLMPEDRWGNLAQDVLPNAPDVRAGLCRYHFLPLETGADTVAAVAGSLLTELPDLLSKFLERAGEC